MPSPCAFLVLAVASLAAGCSRCPPSWVDDPPTSARHLYASGSTGALLGVDEDTVATTRALRALAEVLDLDVERRLSVTEADGRLWVEAVGVDGVHSDAFDGVERVERAECGGEVYVLLRLPREDDR